MTKRQVKPSDKYRASKTTAKIAVLLFETGDPWLERDYDEDKQDYPHDPSLTVRFDVTNTNTDDYRHQHLLDEIQSIEEEVKKLDEAKAKLQVPLNEKLLHLACWYGIKF